ncbi:MAG: hypothetical protein QNJ00_16305 [Woeseiaceae bacterium]|nr:hypothetical protein [Woeseiaceae bacterium]
MSNDVLIPIAIFVLAFLVDRLIGRYRMAREARREEERKRLLQRERLLSRLRGRDEGQE